MQNYRLQNKDPGQYLIRDHFITIQRIPECFNTIACVL